MAKRSVKKETSTDSFREEKKDEDETKHSRAKILSRGLTFDEKRYEYSDRFVEARSVEEAHTVHEIVKFAKANPGQVQIVAKVMGSKTKTFKEGNRTKKETRVSSKILKTKAFIEHYEKNVARFKESDFFGSDSGGSGLVGEDFIPFLGGPFNKQLYYYDYLRMHAIAFQALHHDPFGKRFVQIMNHFVLGKGFRTDVSGKDKELGLAVWRAFEEVNDLNKFAKYFNTELSTYGESMIWELPNNEIYRTYKLSPGQSVPTGLLPRLRLIDPSAIWEIITYPEDISRVLCYQWVAPTQYQIYSAKDGGSQVPTTKFIMQQIPADEVMHEKINCVSNEKRGRSELFAALGYMKRLRDSVNYAIISDQKNSAWSIDTSIDGAESDIDAYVSEQQAMKTIPPAGSEFVHSSKITRQYNANQVGKGGSSPSFDWCVSMISVALGIPVPYWGSHLTGAQSRASAIVGTEPVTKMFEDRQLLIEGTWKKLAARLFKKFGLDCQLEMTFPEIVTSDRSAKIKDTMAADQGGYIKKERASGIIAKELAINDFDPKLELKEIAEQKAKAPSNPLTAPGLLSMPSAGSTADAGDEEQPMGPEEQAAAKKQGREF